MSRIEAQRRIDNAVAILFRRGWTKGQIENMLDGCDREEAVVIAERHADHNHTVRG